MLNHAVFDYRISLCGMNVTSTNTSTTAVSYSVATSSSESLPNDGEKPNQLKILLFPKCDYGSKNDFHKACI